jgi:hypothetical protein
LFIKVPLIPIRPSFNDRLWITTPWTPPGACVFAFVHGEHQGHRHPGRCPTGRYVNCWYNAIGLAVSDDGTQSFAWPHGNHFVAVLPYPTTSTRTTKSYFNPTNILSAGGKFYVMAYATGYRAQQKGGCLLRTRDLGSRLMASVGWQRLQRTVYQYLCAGGNPADVCSPVDEQHLPTVVTSLVQHAQSGAYLAVFVAANEDPKETQEQAIYVAASWDLIRWSGRSKVMPTTMPGKQRCLGPAPLRYPSLLDPNSRSRNFETVAGDAHLFLTRFNLKNCEVGLDRDLIRLPVKIQVQLSGQ